MSTLQDCTNDFLVEDEGHLADRNTRSKPEVEVDAHRIAQRQKQIDYGKNTIGYQRYIKAVPRQQRQRRNLSHPETPDIQLKCSKRGFDAMVKQWRRQLHSWDLDEGEEAHKFVNEELKSPGSAGKRLGTASTPSDKDTGERYIQEHQGEGDMEMVEEYVEEGEAKWADIDQQGGILTGTKRSPAAASSKTGNANRGRKRGLEEVQGEKRSGGQHRKAHHGKSWADAMDSADRNGKAVGDLFADWEDDDLL